MTRIDGDWLEAFDEAMLGFFAIDLVGEVPGDRVR